MIVALLMPETVISHRTAFENRAAPDGSVYVTGPYPRKIVLPGVVLRQLRGPEHVEGDMPYLDGLFLASRARAFLENLQPTKRAGTSVKTVGRVEVERRLAEELRLSGEEALNRLRDQAKVIASELGFQKEFHELDGMIGALMRSRPSGLIEPSARAYAKGEPYDPNRLPVFDALFARLRQTPWPNRPDRATTEVAFHNAAFFDAYFSNYIEGTEFTVDQAIRIVFEHEIPARRPADAHDVLGTYRLVASKDQMYRLPKSFNELLSLIMSRHAVIMEGRPEKLPGQFKIQDNQAGATTFVSKELVLGTLRQGFARYQAIEDPFARALFMMFMIAEVHPFTDGNGRISRVMMNAELISTGQTRIFIPSVFRNEYVSSLKRLSKHQDPEAFIKTMGYAQNFVSMIDFSERNEALRTLTSCNAFADPADDVKLRMPIVP